MQSVRGQHCSNWRQQTGANQIHIAKQEQVVLREDEFPLISKKNWLPFLQIFSVCQNSNI